MAEPSLSLSCKISSENVETKKYTKKLNQNIKISMGNRKIKSVRDAWRNLVEELVVVVVVVVLVLRKVFCRVRVKASILMLL